MLADRVQIQQVLVNLIMNAIDAMGSLNEQERLLTLDSNSNKKEIAITVTDTGTGIEAGNLDRIFEPFFTTKVEGMGLGLSICRSIAEAHGGRLWASAHKAGGAVFHLSLPLVGDVTEELTSALVKSESHGSSLRSRAAALWASAVFGTKKVPR